MKSRMMKIVVFVPPSHTKPMLKALGEAGAGNMGNYSFCTFTSRGTGRFLPNKKAHPAVGKKGKINAVPEDRIETVCESKIISRVLAAVRKVHPYEEPAIDVYPIELIS